MSEKRKSGGDASDLAHGSQSDSRIPAGVFLGTHYVRLTAGGGGADLTVAQARSIAAQLEHAANLIEADQRESDRLTDEEYDRIDGHA